MNSLGAVKSNVSLNSLIRGLNMSIKVLIVDDEPRWLNLYSAILKQTDNINIVDFSNTKERAVERAKIINPDIVLMDLSLSKNKFEGIVAITEILQQIDTKIIVLTSYFENNLIEEAFYAGAVEFVLKDQIEMLPQVIRNVYSNYSPHLVLARSYSYHKKECKFKSLSKTERDILLLKKDGFTHAEIERIAYKSKSTIKKQVTSILAKLNVESCQEAIKKFKQFLE
jgi:DNA-binding NarL/FixJ family response regulator